MLDALSGAIASDGFWVLSVTFLAAGLVRGFTGFGTALIVVPVAGIYLPPPQILMVMGVSGLLANLLLVPSAWGQADRGEVGVLAIAAIVGVPLGAALLGVWDALAIRWVVAGVCFATLIAVISGWQWRGRLGTSGLTAVGFGAGCLGGLTALSGPLVLMFYLANARRAEAVRANMILFLGALDFLLIAAVLGRGEGEWSTVWLTLLVSIPYLLAISVGKALFDPSKERLYRTVAYLIVGIAVLTGLPIWDA